MIIQAGAVVTEDSQTIVFEIKNKRPVELVDLTASLSAFGEQYKRFVTENGGIDSEARLYVHDLRKGSIIAELIPWLKQADLILEHRDKVAGFVTHWKEILEAILHLSDKAKAIPKPELRAARTIVAPVAKDGGSQLNIIATDGGQIVNNFYLGAQEAAAITHNATHLLKNELPGEDHFSNEPMVLYQMRNAPPGKAGDMGFIDRFTTKPIKLTFGDEATKEQILHSAQPFDVYFFVSGTVKTAGGNVAAYHITALDGVSPRDAA